MAGRLDRALNISDLRLAAKARAHKMSFDYIDGGADDEWSLTENSAAFYRYSLLHRVLRGVDDIDPSTTLLGQKIPYPFILSPAAGQRLFHSEGERATAKAAAKDGVTFCLSTLSSYSIEEIASVSSGPKWFQLYVYNNKDLVRSLLQRAKDAGYTAMILTVDLAVPGNREKDPRNGFSVPPKMGPKQIWEAIKSPAWTYDFLTTPKIQYANISTTQDAISLSAYVGAQLSSGFNWDDAEWILNEWSGPSLLKGVVRPDDAKRAADLGFNGIIVSNHGGRQLDTSVAPIRILEEIVQAVGDRADVILDGGVRRGTDILKALALGAKAVGFARPYLFGLAAGGEAGVARALDIMCTSIRRDMALLGVRKISEIDRTFVTESWPSSRKAGV